MVMVISGDRIGREARLGLGTSAFVLDESRQKVLLTRRADDGTWCVPGGFMEAGESFSEACAREVREETGLIVEVKRLLSVYTSPLHILRYADGNKWQVACLHFEAEAIGGALSTSDETSEVGFFSPDETRDLIMHELDRSRICDGFRQQAAAIVYDDIELD